MSKYITINDRQTAHMKYDGKCAYCGITLEYSKMQVDHVIPLLRGTTHKEAESRGIKKGLNNVDNYNPSCRSCNSSKSTFSIEMWRSELEKKSYRIKRDSSTFRILERFGVVKIVKTDIKFYFENYEKGV